LAEAEVGGDPKYVRESEMVVSKLAISATSRDNVVVSIIVSLNDLQTIMDRNDQASPLKYHLVPNATKVIMIEDVF